MTFINRVIAGPGDRVKMERGRLYVNGVLVERSPLSPDPAVDGSSVARPCPMDALTRSPGPMAFVLGDNRDRANDSRNPEFGTIPLAVIADKASIIWMSPDWRRIGKRQQPDS